MKKVLILTYYWPPAGGPGVQRVLKFAKYLPQFGWEPVILTVKNGEYPAIDESLLQDIPENLKVYKTKTLEPFQFYKSLSNSKGKAIETYTLTEVNGSFMSKLFKWIRLNLFIPDARIGWKRYAYKEGVNIVKDLGIDLVFSSSPPHSLQLAAMKIAAKTGLPWVADFRDLWLDAFYIPTEEQTHFAKTRNAFLEKKVLQKASKVCTTSEEIKEDFLAKLPSADVSVVYNGYDGSDFSEIKNPKNKAFTIRYFGFISSGQNPLSLFNSLVTLRKVKPEVYSNIKVEFFGKVDGTVFKSIEEHDLKDCVSYMGYVSHSEVTKLMSSSDCLLLLLPTSKYRGMVPGKLFEYMASKKEVLGIGDKESEVSRLLTDTECGEMFGHDADITEHLLSLYNSFVEGDDATSGTDKVKRFSRQSQTQALAELFDKTIN